MKKITFLYQVVLLSSFLLLNSSCSSSIEEPISESRGLKEALRSADPPKFTSNSSHSERSLFRSSSKIDPIALEYVDNAKTIIYATNSLDESEAIKMDSYKDLDLEEELEANPMSLRLQTLEIIDAQTKRKINFYELPLEQREIFLEKYLEQEAVWISERVNSDPYIKANFTDQNNAIRDIINKNNLTLLKAGDISSLSVERNNRSSSSLKIKKVNSKLFFRKLQEGVCQYKKAKQTEKSLYSQDRSSNFNTHNCCPHTNRRSNTNPNSNTSSSSILMDSSTCGLTINTKPVQCYSCMCMCTCHYTCGTPIIIPNPSNPPIDKDDDFETYSVLEGHEHNGKSSNSIGSGTGSSWVKPSSVMKKWKEYAKKGYIVLRTPLHNKPSESVEYGGEGGDYGHAGVIYKTFNYDYSYLKEHPEQLDDVHKELFTIGAYKDTGVLEHPLHEWYRKHYILKVQKVVRKWHWNWFKSHIDIVHDYYPDSKILAETAKLYLKAKYFNSLQHLFSKWHWNDPKSFNCASLVWWCVKKAYGIDLNGWYRFLFITPAGIYDSEYTEVVANIHD